MSFADNITSKKRKLHILNDDNNSHTQSLKKRKFCAINIFDREKQLKNEIKIVKEERDKYKKERDYLINIYKRDINQYEQIFLQMINIMKPSKPQTQSNIQTYTYNENVNNNTNTTMTQLQKSTISISDDAISMSETQSNNNNKYIKENQSPTNYYCKQSVVHGRRNIINAKGKYICKYCSKTFDTFQALGGHISIHKIDKKSKSESNNNKQQLQTEYEKKLKNWNNSHFVSVNCKFCKKHFNDFDEYCGHLKKEFDDDLTEIWLYCNELNCKSTKRYNTCMFISHLATHGYGRPFHCNLNVSERNRIKCNYSTAQKSNLITHLANKHDILLRKQTKKKNA